MFAINRIHDNFFNDVFDVSPKVKNNYWFDETKDSYVLTVELPGYKKENLDVTVDNGKLTICAKRESTKVKASYKQCYSLPKDADLLKVTADLKDGLLTVTIDKNEEQKPRQIEVK